MLRLRNTFISRPYRGVHPKRGAEVQAGDSLSEPGLHLIAPVPTPGVDHRALRQVVDIR